jgi:MYXO-CTERM domain-containing protein
MEFARLRPTRLDSRVKQEESMAFSFKARGLAAAAVLMLAPASALAQNEVADQANEVAEQAQEVEQQASDLGNQTMASDDGAYVARDDDEDEFPWGLLGLLGLAGLAGLRRREPDIHVDARRDSRP